MFCTQDARLFVPYGRSCTYAHPGSSILNEKHVSKSYSQFSLHNFKDISLTGHIQENWYIQKSPCSIENCDEELYFKDNLVVWSRSIGGTSSQTIRCFTMDSPIVEAMWCNFLIPSNQNRFKHKSSESTGCLISVQSSVCVIEDGRMSFFCDDGQDYTSYIPMPIKKVWVIQNGLLFERNTTSDTLNSKKLKQASNKTQRLTTLFSLIHPLDELVPVVYRTGVPNQPPVAFVTDPQQEIVYTSDNPSIVVTFHHESKKHSVWNATWATPDEIDFLTGRSCVDQTSTASPNTSKPTEAYKITPKLYNSSSTLSRYTLPSLSPATDHSHFPSISSKISSPSFIYSHLSSPAVGSRLATFNRTNSPSNKFMSPSQSINSTPYHPSLGASFSKAPLNDPFEPLSPEVCLAHMWTEPIISREGEPASKVFFTSDFNDQQFLCLLVASKQQIRFVKFEENNDKNSPILGGISTISAKDAAPLSTHQLMVVLELSNHIYIYSGLYRMNVVHISGLSSQPRFAQSFMVGDLGPITSSRPASSMDVKLEVPISPVNHELPNDTFNQSFINQQFHSAINDFNICSLRDPVENRFTIELLEGELCRVEMPEISSSSLVSLCLLALKNCLPAHETMMLMSKWYLVRNTPGVAGYSPEWTQFATFLLNNIGYCDEISLLPEESNNPTMSPKHKKRRLSTDGCDEDCIEMMSGDHKSFESIFGANFEFSSLKKMGNESGKVEPDVQPDSKAFLSEYIFHIFFGLHLVYEEMKLDTSLQSNLIELARFLCSLSIDMNLTFYTDHYCRDLPALFQFSLHRPVHKLFEAGVKAPSYFTLSPPNIMEWLYMFLTYQDVPAFPIIPNVTCRIQHIIMIYALKFSEDKSDVYRCVRSVSTPLNTSLLSTIFDESNVDCAILLMAVMENSTQAHLSPCLRIPVIDAIHNCRKNPPKVWSEEAYKLIGREDLATQCKFERNEQRVNYTKEELKSFLNDEVSCSKKGESDGMDHLDSELLKLRFSKDLRIKEIKKLLQSSLPIKVALQQKPGVTDHEFIDEQEKYLYAVSIRTMALPVGRGMLTYGTYVAVPTEALPIPKLCLSGRVPPRNNIIEMTHIELPPNLTEWPQFHNGVSAGLRLTDTTQLDSTWILFNKLKSENMTNEHAGFLMGQGLTGHLSDLHCLDVHDYLIKGNEMISIGLLLGVSANKRGTMEMTATKTLSIHIAALLPPSSAELDVTHNIQVASILGIGLVYQSSAHRHISEVLLAEIGRPPGPEMENSVDRESYSLAAGLALGNVMLAKGTQLLDVCGSEMPDYLYYYMNGRKRKPLSNAYRERYKATSCQIKEGECVNIDVTGPGAIMALGLMFFNSGNVSVAEWLVAPDTPSLLECMKPDLLMLRVIGYGLIMWQFVTPTDKWINSNIPEIVKECAFDWCQISDNPDCNVDIELMSQAYVNIMAGACMVIALKFAGSANKLAFDCLHRHFLQIFRWQNLQSSINYAGRYTLEQCMCVLVLCMAMVMAGTGDLVVLRICRHLRSRIAPHVHYGSHMAIGMACGLLTLGGGKCTLSTKPEAISAMLCSFFPKFPIHANDNRFHLQAFRHLYVLAIEKRILIPCDVDSNKASYADIELVYQNGTVEIVKAPCLLPELDLLSEIKVVGSNYWQIEFKKSENWDALKTILSGSGHLYVKQKANFISQFDDSPEVGTGGNEFLDKILKYRDISSFTNDPYLLEFSSLFLKDSEKINIGELSQFLFKCFYNKITEILPIQIDIHQNIILCSKSTDHTFLMWQFKILYAYYNRVKNSDKNVFSLVSKEFLLAMQNSIEALLVKCLDELGFKTVLRNYFMGNQKSTSKSLCNQLSAYLIWYNIPHSKILLSSSSISISFPSLFAALKRNGLPVSSARMLSQVLLSIHESRSVNA